MIRNERQLQVSQRRVRELEVATNQAEGIDRQVLKSLADDIRAEVQEYLEIRGGMQSRFRVADVDDLGDAVIKARISKGWNQRQLADELGVSEQAVQKDESNSYQNAGLARIAEIMDTIEVELIGEVRPKVVGSTDSSIRLEAASYQGGLVNRSLATEAVRPGADISWFSAASMIPTTTSDTPPASSSNTLKIGT